MPDDEIEIKKTYTGKHIVLYRCAVCRERLKSALRNAGTYETCPVCKHQICVPGEGALEQNSSQLDLPRHRQLDAARLKHDAKINVVEHQISKDEKVKQGLARTANQRLRRKLDNDYSAELVELRCMRGDSKAQTIIQLNDMLLDKLREVDNMNWPDKLKKKVVNSLYEISTYTKNKIMGTS